MPTDYIVQQGDCISSIAYNHGLFPDTVWNDPANSELKQLRKDPNVLMPGDVVYVRDIELKEEACATEKRHRFRRKGVPSKLIIHFYRKGVPRANESYILTIEGVLSHGKTDAQGAVQIPIPPDAASGRISFTKFGDAYDIDLGALDPITEISGIQGRLSNLGYYSGPIDGQINEQLTQAIRAFKTARNPTQEPDGDLDEPTRKQIQQASGG